MTTETITPAAPPRSRRILFAIPVLGWIARDLIHGDKDNIWYLLVAVLSLWAMAVMTWGVPALYLPALAAVPVIFLMLLWITRG
ncbi:hypothetical protein [Actibacterium ureilyticum]|uniref:hypothetical protein n=1 Tax=Actibacterium ureilyticum TaxID=1590614 RepID=UPI000BAAF8E7|nr:hypothetical protein [Actibacterium ureilyticum]